MTQKVIRSAIYIRVSTAEQMVHGKSLQAQQECLERYAQEHNMTVAGIYADEGKTARKELKKRKAIHSLLLDVRAGEIDTILFWRLDRWFRNLSDFYKVQDVLDEYGVNWISVSEPGINMETRDGRLQLNVVLSIGQNEVDTTSERIRFVNEASIRQGKLIFGDANMPLGYKADVVDCKKCMVKDPEAEAMVNDFFLYFKTHQSKTGTVKYMQNTYGIDFSYSMLRTMLSSEFYKGTYRGFPYCPAYLTEQEWEDIQQIAHKNIKQTPSGRIYLFSSLMRCPECGQLLCGTGCSSIINRKTREKRTYCYYRCNRAAIDKLCKNRHRVSQNLIEQYLLDNLEEEYRKYRMRCEKIEEKKKKRKKSKTPEKLQRELERLNLLFQKDRIDWEYYNKEYDRIENELKELSPIQPVEQRDYSHLEKILDTNFKSMYGNLTPENRRAFWRSTLKEIHLKDDCTVNYIDFL
ncbi:recombinase family protein [Sporofaciens musculi]|uniref:recombinase family protein n=1 Tax=Sporofaciens musculi TaxID=2681861 RepID=UPI00259CCDB5|nr:recombinase family protein [Sporofaciens musculi]